MYLKLYLPSNKALPMNHLSTQITTSNSSHNAPSFCFQTDIIRTNITLRDNTSTTAIDKSTYEETSTIKKKKKIVSPPPQTIFDHSEDIDATVIQLWEGRVLDVDFQNEIMHVLLTAKMGSISEHTAEIEFQWISQQDTDLITPGAVFYLTLYKQTRHGSIKNCQELRFRRRPAWTKQQVQKIYADADFILSKMRARPIAT